MDRIFLALPITKDNELADHLHISAQAVSKAKKRLSIPSSWIFRLRNEYSISADWLLTGTGPMRRGESVVEDAQLPFNCLTTEEYELVPLISSWVTGGPQGEILYEGITDKYPFKRWWIERLVGRSPERKGALLLVRVRGDSMVPTIGPGEVILVDTSEAERLDIRTGQIYLVKQPDGGVAVKRLALSERGERLRLICISDNPTRKPFEFELDTGRRIQDYVLGRVRWAGKEFD